MWTRHWAEGGTKHLLKATSSLQADYAGDAARKAAAVAGMDVQTQAVALGFRPLIRMYLSRAVNLAGGSGLREFSRDWLHRRNGKTAGRTCVHGMKT